MRLCIESPRGLPGFLAYIYGIIDSLQDWNMRHLVLCLSVFITGLSVSAHASVQDKFHALKTKPEALYAFLKAMPKGGELHYHYDGAVYTETMLNLAHHSQICVDPSSLSSQLCTMNPNSLPVKTIIQQPPLLNKIVHNWSMADFKPHTESAHDHFFAVFPKVATIYSQLKGDLLAAILQKAAEQHELYMEIIAFGLAEDDYYAKLIRHEKDFAKKKEILLANPAFQRSIQNMVTASHTFLPAAHSALHCATQPTQPACRIQVNFQAYVRRVKSIDAVFAQALAGFAAAEQSPRIVGINLVDIEDNVTAQQDYAQQMQIFGFLHTAYPKVHIALHAGELYPNSVAHHQVLSPIRGAILVGHAQRIGHGLDIVEEPDPRELAQTMAKLGIAVEINLTSNALVFGVHGQQHPLRFYLEHHVPVVLSTDDEGILRTELTHEYMLAVQSHHLDYASLKQINRNTLTYGFIDGDSIWADPQLAKPVAACRVLSSRRCRQFIRHHHKAQLQWQLEQELSRFEQHWQ